MNRTPTRITIDGQEYVLLTPERYETLQRSAGVPKGSVDAIQFAREAVAYDLRAAREHAGLTQVELAKRMRKSQAMVSGTEKGRIEVSQQYVRAVLKACGLPADWAAPRPRARRRAA